MELFQYANNREQNGLYSIFRCLIFLSKTFPELKTNLHLSIHPGSSRKETVKNTIKDLPVEFIDIKNPV